jgi:hypothetical protein
MNEESSIAEDPIYDFVVNPFIKYIINLNPQRTAEIYAKYKIISVINLSNNSSVVLKEVVFCVGNLISLKEFIILENKIFD